MSSSCALLFWTILMISPLQAFAFPDTIRHGYASCTTCHISPAGGGLLNGYGRSLSKELMSTWGYKDEEQPLHGLAPASEKTLEHFAIGGDARYLNRKYKNTTGQVDEGFLMQTQVRAGLLFEKIKFLASIGNIENPRKSSTIRYVSPEYFILWTPDEKVRVRVGRFEPIYGLRLPDHNLWVKSETGFVPWIERDTTEMVYESETQMASLAGFQSTAATATNQQMTGYSGSFYQVVYEKTRLGFSTISSEGQGMRKKSHSLTVAHAFSDVAYLMVDASMVSVLDSRKSVAFARLGYEAFKGFTPFLQGQLKRDHNNASSNQSKTGLGLIWLPRPHFEFMASIEQLNGRQGNSSEGLLVSHYYF